MIRKIAGSNAVGMTVLTIFWFGVIGTAIYMVARAVV